MSTESFDDYLCEVERDPEEKRLLDEARRRLLDDEDDGCGVLVESGDS